MTGKIEWKFRHILKDGTVLRPGDRLPSTEEAVKTIDCALDAARWAAMDEAEREEILLSEWPSGTADPTDGLAISFYEKFSA